MPKSRSRAKKPSALSGIPASVISLAPKDFSAAQKAQWARHYIDGAAGRPYARPRGSSAHFGHWSHTAHRMGAESRGSAKAAHDARQSHLQQGAEEERSRRSPKPVRNANPGFGFGDDILNAAALSLDIGSLLGGRR